VGPPFVIIAPTPSGGAAAALDGTDQNFGGNAKFFVKGTDYPKG
jgi:hypothetical protein